MDLAAVEDTEPGCNEGEKEDAKGSILTERLLHGEGRADGASQGAALDCGYSHGQRPTWRRHQCNDCRREGLEISCARADLASCYDKETDL